MIMLIILILVMVVIILSLTAQRRLIPTIPQILAENIYEHGINFIGSNVGRRGMVFFPYLFSMYIFIACTNLFGGLPYSNTLTAQLIITAGMGVSTFIGLIILSVQVHGINLFSAFLPSGAPKWIAPLLVVIELVSFLFRPLSLSVRLFANIMAGHTLVVIITSFGYKFLMPLSYYSIVSVGIFSLLICILTIETGVQFIQAYVFTLLTCNYISNTLYLDH